MYHCDTFDMYLDSRYLQKRTFRDRGFGCKALSARHFRMKEECRMGGMAPVSHGLTRMGTKLGPRGATRPPYPWNPRQPWLHFAESGFRIAECRKAELGMQEPKG